MDFKRIATIIGVAIISYFGFYLVLFAYNFIAMIFSTPGNEYKTMAFLTAIILNVVYTVKTRRQ